MFESRIDRPKFLWSLLAGFGVGVVISALMCWIGLDEAASILITGAIGAGVTFVATKSDQRAQLTATIWPERMKAHQRALHHWRECAGHTYADQQQRDEVLMRARSWWFENDLYLSGDASTGFKEMLDAVWIHQDLVEDGRGKKDPELAKQVKKNYAKIQKAGQLIQSGAGSRISEDLIKKLMPPSDDAS
ncbi:MAG: hypothetical protein AAGC86_13575 [Pseudomonadota bacterium]